MSIKEKFKNRHITTVSEKEIKMKVAYLIAVIALCIFAFGTRTADAGYVSKYLYSNKKYNNNVQ